MGEPWPGCSIIKVTADEQENLARLGSVVPKDWIVREIRTDTAKFGASYKGGGKGLFDSQRDLGGWLELRLRPAHLDSEHDGIPDDWERAHGLDPNDLADGARAANADCYTHQEVYLNSLIPFPNQKL
ncbi:MAG: hypothetical protein EXS37_08590 [Opitutus sp.]|nr:hypothetical protein [Opitutus sp.]